MELTETTRRSDAGDSRARLATAGGCPVDAIDGVNLIGYLRTESGVGAAGRGYARALAALEVPLALYDLSSLSGNRASDETFHEFSDGLPFGVNLVCIDVEPHFAALARLGAQFFDPGRHNIGVWAWELPEFPVKWHDRFAWYDEIWVASSFIAKAITPVSPIPVVCVPPVLSVPGDGDGVGESRRRGRRRLGVDAEELVFLFVFDFNSHIERKNPQGLIEAFGRAFAGDEAARLVIKCVNPQSNQRGFDEMCRLAAGRRVDILSGYWAARDVRDLMAACDAYVSLHRSEGTGLTITDAMALGKPVIATGWSGNMDFMSVSNSYPVRYDLVKIERTVGPYRVGGTWAEPSIAHAAEQMRRIFEDREDASKVGARAARDIAENYSEEVIAELIRVRLATIGERCGPRRAAWQAQQRATYFAYRELVRRVVSIAEALPENSVIAVASRGDEELVRFCGRTGWHFPRTAAGLYAGHHPADSAEAILQLEDVQRAGADFFLLPATMKWWLEYYGEFADLLRRRHRVAYSDDAATVYELAPAPAAAVAGKEVR
jgi:glycosyltransferase involved in cell wall biosynthesis